MSRRFQRVLFYGGLVALWAGLAHVGIWPVRIFPGPAVVWGTFRQGVVDHSILLAIEVSLKRILVGYALSAAGGILLGLLTARITWLENTMGSLIVGLQTLPSICWIPAAILWFGPSEAAILFVVIMGSMLTISVGTRDAVKNLPPIYVQAARTMSVPELRVYTRVIFPGALAGIVSTLKQGWVFAWRSLLGAELLSTVPGLGNLLKVGQAHNQISLIATLIIVIMAIGWTVDYFVFSLYERHIRRSRGMAV